MPIVKPFPALRPRADQASKICELPYDVVTSEEARRTAGNNPLSFFHVSKPEIDLPAGTNPCSEAVYRTGSVNFKRLITEGSLKQDSRPAFYLYRLIMAGHAQLGLVAVVRCRDYTAGLIKKHELTRPDKEEDRIRHMEALNSQTGPVFLTYRADPGLDGLFSELVSSKPWVDFTAPDGVQHAAWVVDQDETIAKIGTSFEKVPAFYIADGHHRSAAAVRLSESRGGTAKDGVEKEAWSHFLAVIFPHNQLRILPYNRVVRDLNGLSAGQFLERLRKLGIVESNARSLPEKHHEVCIYLPDGWHRFHWGKKIVAGTDAVGRLDVSLLQEHVLFKILGIEDPRRDQRIAFVGGIRGTRELEKLVDSGTYAVAFSMHPTGIEQLMNVSDQDQLMPPKSTWFEPKLRDGLFSHML